MIQRRMEGENEEFRTCDYCAYRDIPQAVVGHVNKLPVVNGKHPKEEIIKPCTHCQAILISVNHYSRHMRDKHNFRGILCRAPECLKWFKSNQAYWDHKMEFHGGFQRKTEPKTPATVEKDTALNGEVIPPPKPQEPDDLMAAIGCMLQNAMDQATAEKDARIAVLEAANEELKADLARMAERDEKVRRLMKDLSE